MKNILITGGAGFIGSHLVDRLLEENKYRVIVVDNFNDFYSLALKHQNVSQHLKNPSYTLVKTDICSRSELEQVFKDNALDCIVHLAARAGVRPSLEQPELYEETNIRGTLNLLELARIYGVEQFVFGSSSSVYGANAKIPFSEEDSTRNPISPYAMTKAAGELLCHTYSHLYNLRCVCLRFFTVYGARQRPDLAIHKFARLIFDGKPIPVFGDGTTRRDYTYIEDIVSGIQEAINYQGSQFEAINLGESQTIELRELIEVLEEGLGKKASIDWLPLQPGDVPQTFADIDKAKKLLGYNPHTKIKDGIGKFINWFEEINKSSDN